MQKARIAFCYILNKFILVPWPLFSFSSIPGPSSKTSQSSPCRFPPRNLPGTGRQPPIRAFPQAQQSCGRWNFIASCALGIFDECVSYPLGSLASCLRYCNKTPGTHGFGLWLHHRQWDLTGFLAGEKCGPATLPSCRPGVQRKQTGIHGRYNHQTLAPDDLFLTGRPHPQGPLHSLHSASTCWRPNAGNVSLCGRLQLNPPHLLSGPVSGTRYGSVFHQGPNPSSLFPTFPLSSY